MWRYKIAKGHPRIIGVVDGEVAAKPVAHGIPDVEAILRKWIVNDWLQPTSLVVLPRHSPATRSPLIDRWLSVE